MTQQNHKLEIYEPYEYTGPNPISALGIGVMAGPAGNHYYLLAIENPLQVDDDIVEQILVQCRYSEDHIARPTNSMCTVNIARVRPGKSLQLDSVLTFDDFVPWGVGKITVRQPVN